MAKYPMTMKVDVEFIQQVKGAAFIEGAKYVLEYLHDVYGEGLEETDIWADYMTEGEAN